MCLIDYNNYSGGTWCFAKYLKGIKLRPFIFVRSGWCKGMTERRKLRSRELLKICTRLTIALQKNRNIRCLLKEYWGLFQGHLYLTSSDKVVFEKSMPVLSFSLEYQLKRRERRKSVVLKNRCKIFWDNNHHSLYKKIKLYKDIKCRESGTSIRKWVALIITLKSPLSAATSRLGDFKSQKITLARIVCLCFTLSQ